LGIALNKMDAVRSMRETTAGAARAPVESYLAELHERVLGVTGGKPADYIPELGKADPNLFGIAIATVAGQIYAVGDAGVPFTIQSVS
jgi:glutaminase